MRYSLTALLLLLVVSSSGRAADIDLGPALTVAPGGAVPLPVLLASAAPPGGITVTLTSSDPSKVTISPDSVYIPGGLNAPFGSPRVTGVAFGTAAISATAFGLSGASQSVQVSATLSGPPSQTIPRGSTLNAVFALSWPTPSAVTLNLRSDNPAIASVPSTAAIPPGGTNAVIPITGVATGTSIIHISALPDIAESTVTVNVFSPGSITLSPVTLTLGQSLPFPVALASPATGTGVLLQLTSSSPTTVVIVPSSVFIPAGQTTPASQPEIAGEDIGLSTISVSAPGYLTASQQVPVTATITMSPTTLRIPVGGIQILSLILSAAAPSVGVPITPDRAAGGFVNGLTVNLSSSDQRVAAVQPTVQFYPDGSSITTVVVVISGLTQGTATIHAGVPPYIPDAVATVIVGNPSSGPASLTPVGGTPQTAQINTPFGLPLSVRALDASLNPVSGVSVTFGAPGSGPSAAFAGGVSTALTDASGVARSQTLTANSIAGTYQVTASAPGVAVPSSFTLTNVGAASGGITLASNVTVAPNQTLPFALTLTAPAPSPSGVTVTLTSSDPSKAAIAPSTISIPAGATAPGAPPVLTGVNFGSTTISASAPGYTSASQLVQVGATLSFSPASLTINGPGTQNLNLNLSAPAPSTGLIVALNSNNAQAASVPPSIFFAPNTSSVSVPVTGLGSGFATIKATAGAPNIPSATAGVTVVSQSGISLAAGVKVAPGESVALPVFLTSPARPGGVTVTLTTSDSSKLTISPANLYIFEGMTSPFTQPFVTGVSLGTATVTASAYGLTGSTQVVQVAGKLSGPASQTIQRGSTANLIFVLSWPTPAALTFGVSSDNPAIATVPASVTIPANQTMAIVPVTAVLSGSTTIHIAAPPDIAESTVNIIVQSPGTITISNGAPLPLGQSGTLSVSLAAPAPQGGLVISLSSSDPSTVSISPNSVFIPAGATVSPTNPVVTGFDIGLATITASAPGYLDATRQVIVSATITISPDTLVIPVGSTRLIALALSASAPSGGPITPDRGAGGFVNGLTVQLSSSNPGVANLQPTVQFYPDGSSITTVVVVVSGIAPGTAIIHANALPYIPDVTTTVIVQ